MARRAGLRLELFGGPALWRDGRHVGTSPYQAALLSVVFGEGRDRLSRSFVHRLLWEDAHRRAVRHRASQLVYQTNRRCGARILSLEGEFVRARAGAVGCDLDDFEEMIRVPRLEDACDLLEQGFLSAFPRQRTRALADWIEERQVTMRAKLRRRALSVWEFAERRGDWSHARQAAEALLRLEPQDEAVLRRVMKATALGGMVREAEAVYQAFADHARPSGEWTPERETTVLLRSVRSAVRIPRTASESLPPLEVETPFLGREEELAHLTRSIYGRRAGDRLRVVVVGGEAGIGKTRLVEEAIQGARFRGYRVLRATSAEMQREMPLRPLLEGLNQPWTGPLLRTVEEPWRSVLLCLMPQFDEGTGSPPQSTPSTPEAAAERTCEALLRLFEAVARDRRTIFFLDDLHWADPATLAVLQLARRSWRPDRLTLALAHRPEELRGHDSAARLVRALAVDPRSTVVRLGPLPADAAREVAAAVAAQRPTDAALDRVVALAGGNPFFLTELAQERAADRIPPRPEDEPSAPTSARQLILRRFAQLDAVPAKVAAGLAVCGCVVTLGQLCQITAIGRIECVDALETLRRLRFVRWTEHGVAVRNEIVRKTVYDDLDRTRRARLHAATAEMLRSQSRPPSDQVALHHDRGDLHEPADQREPAKPFAAADEAEDGRPADLMRLLRLAYAADDEPGSRSVAVRLARARFDAQELADARRWGEEALEHAPAEWADRAHRGQGVLRAESIEMGLVVAVARRRLGTDPPSTTLAKLAELERAALEEREETLVARVMEAALQALDAAAPEGPDSEAEIADLVARAGEMATCAEPGARCRIMALLAADAACGSPSDRLAWSRRALTLVRDHELPAEEMLVCQRHVQALAANGLLSTEEGRAAVAVARAAAARTRDVRARALFLFQLADWRLVAGALEAAEGVMAEHRAALGASDCPGLRFLEWFGRGATALARGDLRTAERAFAEAREFPTHDVSPHRLARLAGLEGRLLLDMGRIREAAELARRAPVETDAPCDLYAFHARYLSRVGEAGRAVTLLEKGLAETVSARPASWLRLALEFARLARRSGRPRTKLARLARTRAEELELPGLAHEFVPYVD